MHFKHHFFYKKKKIKKLEKVWNGFAPPPFLMEISILFFFFEPFP